MFGWLKSLFSGDGSATEKVQFEEEYKGYLLRIAPQRQGGQFRVAATICKVDNPERVHHLIRADLLPDLDSATDETLRKAKLAVDQLGDGMFKD